MTLHRLSTNEVLAAGAVTLALAAVVWARAMRRPPAERPRWRRLFVLLPPIWIAIDAVFLGLLDVVPTRQLNGGRYELWNSWSRLFLCAFFAIPVCVVVALAAVASSLHGRRFLAALDWFCVLAGMVVAFWVMLSNMPDV